MRIEILLVETQTFWLLESDGNCLVAETPFSEMEDASCLIKPTLVGKSKATQTILPLLFSEKVQTRPLILKEQAVQATVWDLYDSIPKERNSNDVLTRQTSTLTALGRSLDSNEIAPIWADMVGVTWPHDPLDRNTEHKDIELKRQLVSQECKNLIVNWIHCNPFDHMLFLVAYKNPTNQRGYVACWNIQNIDYPEILIPVGTNPIVAKFSHEIPHLIAIGDKSGMVNFVDICHPNVRPSRKETANLGHMGSVMDICWVQNSILSSGSDGRIILWTFKKDFLHHCQVIAQLQPSFYNLELPRTIKDCGISKELLPFPEVPSCAISIKERNKFIVGSEDGSLHTFSFSQSDFPLYSQRSHIGPVIRTEIIQLHEQEMLITLGNDNMIFLQKMHGDVQELSPQITGVIVNFACNPDDPELLAVLKQDAIEIWKIFPAPIMIGRNKSMPELTNRASSLISVAFVPKSKALLIGDDVGKIHLYSYSQLTYESDQDKMPSYKI